MSLYIEKKPESCAECMSYCSLDGTSYCTASPRNQRLAIKDYYPNYRHENCPLKLLSEVPNIEEYANSILIPVARNNKADAEACAEEYLKLLDKKNELEEQVKRLPEAPREKCKFVRVENETGDSPKYIAVRCNKCEVRYARFQIMKLMLNEARACPNCGREIER